MLPLELTCVATLDQLHFKSKHGDAKPVHEPSDNTQSFQNIYINNIPQNQLNSISQLYSKLAMQSPLDLCDNTSSFQDDQSKDCGTIISSRTENVKKFLD